MSEIKHTLRKQGFPYCAREALVIIEQLTVTQNAGRSVISKSMELASEIMAEFVFGEFSDSSDSGRSNQMWNARSKKLNCIQELQLLEVLCDYFSYPCGSGNDAARNTVFMNLFPDTHKQRAQLLVKLVSISISTKSKSVLSATGIWMQQLGCTSEYSLQLAKGLVNDYFVLVPRAVENLQDLPKLAPQFTANFLTAVAELYGVTDNQVNQPPEPLLAVVTEWVTSSTSLCTAALNCPVPALPQGGIPMPPITPFAVLFKWCILNPLASKVTSPHYSRLHLALLESLLESGGQDNVVSAQHLATIVEPLVRLSQECSNSDAVQLALDRMGQAVQVTLASRSIYGNKQELFKQLDLLPYNRLLNLVKAKHRAL